HATLNSMVQELVLIAIRLTRSSAWPAGRSVQLADIRAAVGRDARASDIADHLRTRGRSIGSVLGDLTKERIAGRRRVVQQIVKVGAVNGSGPFYDAPGEAGFERRRLIVLYRTVQAELAPHVLKELEVEFRMADRFRQNGSSAVLKAIGTARLLAVHRE